MCIAREQGYHVIQNLELGSLSEIGEALLGACQRS